MARANRKTGYPKYMFEIILCIYYTMMFLKKIVRKKSRIIINGNEMYTKLQNPPYFLIIPIDSIDQNENQ